MSFDPDAAASPGSGVFGLPHSRSDSSIVLLPVPFDATTSYGGGAAGGPEAIRNASAQVDLLDGQFGEIYRCGIHMLRAPAWIRPLSRRARALARPIIERGGATARDARAVRAVDQACERINTHTHATARKILAQGKIPGLIGGDHSTPFGAIRACAEVAAERSRDGLGILQIDAHMDLRDGFEGFAWSHASIMHNVMSRLPNVCRLVQIGIRDFGRSEADLSKGSRGRVRTHFDLDWARAIDRGEQFDRLCDEAIKPLPKLVYISFDIDGLEPSLCPHTGTPVPGGLSFHRACMLLEALVRSGRSIVGFDLNEVSPGPNPKEPEWDANVGARVLYKLCGAAARSTGRI
ncbi:MAG: agmatinase family protein [Phycisphaerae bacterium]|nr:agmatinase family protein [Phycisphaerae bacterium]